MYPEIETILQRFGYLKIRLNISGISLALKQQRDSGCVVVTIDETTGIKYSKEQFMHISEIFREFLRQRECFSSIFLYILISEDDNSVKRLMANYDNYWRIIPSKRKLMIYEAYVPEFEELRNPLEQMFSGYDFYDNIREYRNEENRNFMPDYGSPAGNEQRRAGFPIGNGKIPAMNIFIVLVNIVIFFITDFAMFQDDSIVEWGALNWDKVLKQGQWYRLISSMFLHDGVQHIFNNMLVLVYIGSYVEQRMGKIRYGILYFASGILAGFTSMVYNMNLNENVYSLGASGAIFGVMGALLCLVVFKNRSDDRYNTRQIVLMAVFSLYSGIASQGVDNAAHIGGFLFGFLLAAVLGIGLKKRYSS